MKPDTDPLSDAVAALAAEVRALQKQSAEAEQAIKGEVIHSSLISRGWAAGGALVVLIAFGIYLGGYKRQVDDALERVPVLERAAQDHDARLRELERHHRQGRLSPAGAGSERDSADQSIASGAY